MSRSPLRKLVWSSLGSVGRPVCKRLCGRTYPADDMQRLAAVIKPEAILDIGAHVGTFATSLASKLPGVPIHAFEPTPASAATLRAAVRHFPSVYVHEIAVSSHTGVRDLFLNSNSQTNSLLENDDANNRFYGTLTEHLGRVSVQTTTLDSWVEAHSPGAPLFIKVDIQGAELHLIKGGGRTLEHSTAVFFSEASLAPLYQGAGDLFQIHEAITKSLPFVLLDIYRTYRNGNGRAMWTDAMWIHRDYLSLIGE
jgi:FkbM family methyltransferase